MSGIRLDVKGLDDLRRELRKVDPQLNRGLGRINKEAGELVASESRSRAIGIGSSAAKGAKSIKASAKSRAVIVALGGARAPWEIGSEFGSKQGPGKKQFPPFTGNQWTPNAGSSGYFLMPAIRDTRPQFERVYLDALDGFFKSSFPH